MSTPGQTPPPGNSKGPGRIIAVYGRGAGKTTRCVGLAVRAAGAGLKVSWVQFMKGPDSSETKIFALIPNLDFFTPGPHPFLRGGPPQDVHLEHAAKALERARRAVDEGVQMLVCDEILNAVFFKTLPEDAVLELARLCRGRVELVMSGLEITPRLLEAADYATELGMVKHPYHTSGQAARKGIEF